MSEVNIAKVIESLSGLQKPQDKSVELLSNKQIKRILIKKINEGVPLGKIVEVLKNNQISISIPTLRKWKKTYSPKTEASVG